MAQAARIGICSVQRLSRRFGPVGTQRALGSPDRKCELRILGPIDLAGQFEWYELTVQPGGALESEPYEPGSREHLSVLSGALEVTAGEHSARVKSGETARYLVDQRHSIRNRGRTAATALLVVLHG